MIAVSEIGRALLAVSDNGYNVLVGSTPSKPLLFTNYATHPNVYNKAMNSTAAGRYQFLFKYWNYYQRTLQLEDFGHDCQDRWALALIRECKASDDVDAGRFDQAVEKCRSRWASLPGAGYNQHENSLTSLREAYEEAGGRFA